MDNQPLVHIFEQRFHSWAVGSLLIAAIIRLLWGYLSVGSIWLNDCQIFTVSILVACLLIGGCFVPLPWSYIVSYLCGGFAWVVALSLVPPTLWSQYSALRVDLPDWQVIAAGIIAVASFVCKAVMQRRWRGEIGGHSFQWMLNWAKGKPYYARMTARHAMLSLGYRF